MPRPSLSLFLWGLCLTTLLLLTGCEDASVGPTLRGSIEGQVLDFEDRTPVPGAGLTTSPATGSFLTDNDGAFLLDDLEAGTYSVTVRRNGFNANTVSVAVRDGGVTPATIFLERDTSGTETPKLDSLAVQIVNWANRVVSSDSTFVDVEYRVQNAGERRIRRYEVYVRIATDGDPFFEEVRGDTLRIGQADVGSFSKFIRSETARQVTVDDVFINTPSE